MSSKFIAFTFSEETQQLAPIPGPTVGLFDLDVTKFQLFQSKVIILLEPFRSSTWIIRYKELENEDKGLGDRVVQNGVYAHVSEELFRSGYINTKDSSKLPKHVDAVCAFLYEAARHVSKGLTFTSMVNRSELVVSIEQAFNEHVNNQILSSNPVATKQEELTTPTLPSPSGTISDSLSLKDFREESDIAENLREIAPFKGERDVRSAIRWRREVEDQCDHLASPIVTFYYAKRSCDTSVWKKLWPDDMRSIPRTYEAYSKAVATIWNKASNFDSQASKELLLVNWVNLKQRRDEAVADFAERLRSLRAERELFDMAPKDDEVKAIFRRGLKNPKLALWALDRTHLKVDQFISKVISREEEMGRLGILKKTDTAEQKSDMRTKALCKTFARTGQCRYGARCRYAHGKEESLLEPAAPTAVTPGVTPVTTPTVSSPPLASLNTSEKSTTSTSRKTICYNCRQEGHISRDCPLRNSQETGTDPLKAVQFSYVEPVRFFGSMTIDFVISPPNDTTQSCALKALLDTGAKRNYLDKATADTICSKFNVPIIDLPNTHVSSQVDGTTLRSTKCIRLYVSTTSPVVGDPIIQFLILEKLNPKAIIGLDGMKRLGTEIILDNDLMVQFKSSKLPKAENVVHDYHGDLVAVLDECSQGNLCRTEDCPVRDSVSTIDENIDDSLSLENAIDKLKTWQPVGSAPDYKIRVRKLDDDEQRDVPQQQYCFELFIPIKDNSKKSSYQYDYSASMISRLNPEERDSYEAEINGYLQAGFWQDPQKSPLPRRYTNIQSEFSAVVVFPVRQEGRHTRIRPCADARRANQQSAGATYKGRCISSMLQHIMVSWRTNFCVHTRDVKKAFYVIRLYAPIRVVTNSMEFVTTRMIFGLFCGPSGLEHCLATILALARLRVKCFLQHGFVFATSVFAIVVFSTILLSFCNFSSVLQFLMVMPLLQLFRSCDVVTFFSLLGFRSLGLRG